MRQMLDAPRSASPSELSAARRQTFELRMRRWWPDLLAGLAEVYPAEESEALAARLGAAAERAFAERDPDLQRLDEARTLTPDWFQSPRTLGYAAYTERFAGRLSDVADQLPYLQELGVTYLHLMPLLQPRPGDNDGGSSGSCSSSVSTSSPTNVSRRPPSSGASSRSTSAPRSGSTTPYRATTWTSTSTSSAATPFGPRPCTRTTPGHADTTARTRTSPSCSRPCCAPPGGGKPPGGPRAPTTAACVPTSARSPTCAL